jgi:hypothetical protein
MDAVSAYALGAPRVVFYQQRHIARVRQLAQPEIQGLVNVGSILAKQNAGNVSHGQGFGQGSLGCGRRPRRKREVEPARWRGFSHLAASACLSLRDGAVLSVSVSNHAGRGAVNVRRPAAARRSTAGVTAGGSTC